MAVVNLYSSASSMWTFKVLELGDISGWTEGWSADALQAIGNGMYCYGSDSVSRPTVTSLNKTDYGTTGTINLYANSLLHSRIELSRYGSGNMSGYISMTLIKYSGAVYPPSANVSYGDYYSYVSSSYLATAYINGNYKFGVFVYCEAPNKPSRGCFCTNDAWSTEFLSELKIINDNNPFWGGGYSEPGGGDSNKQNWGETSDFVSPDSLPDETQVGAVGCGLITIFTPDQAQLTRLAEMLWNKTFYDYLVNQFNGIEDLFVSLGIVPFTVTPGQTAVISFMDYWNYISPGPLLTRVSLTKAAKQWEEFNMGNVSLTGGDTNEGFTSDSVLDYSPYSKLGIYLPFIGYQELDIDECRDKTINLKYRIDILSGACLALISINGRTVYQFTGNCMTQLPLTSMDYSQIVQTATNVAIAASSAGTAGAIASAGDALTASRLENGKIDAAMGDYQNAQHAAQVSNGANSLAGATANGMMGMKPSFKKTGAISGSTSIFGVMQPYLHLTTPRQSMPDGYERVCGFPCNVGGKLSDFTGYTVVEDVRLNGLVATSPEVEEIYKLLKSGIII